MSKLDIGKTAGALAFVLALGVQAAQSWTDPSFVVSGPWRFGLFVAAAVLAGAQLVLPRPGEKQRPIDTADRHAP